MSISGILKKIYLKCHNNKYARELTYLYFFMKDIPCDITLGMLSERKQRWIKSYLYKIFIKTNDEDLLNDKIQNTKYKKLKYILELSKRVKNGERYYIKIKSNIDKRTVEKIRTKKKIIVGFMANYSATWIGDELYYLFEKSERFEPYIYTLANYNGQSDMLVKDEYERLVQFFMKKDMRIVETYDTQTGKTRKWKENEVKPDICIWLTSWLNLFDREYRIDNFLLNTLHTYIPYGFMIAENMNNNFVYHQYNHRMHNMVWKNFEESAISVFMAQKYSFIKGDNAVFTGYPKMDHFYLDEKNDIWQSVIEKSCSYNAKRIIYAPHHTLDVEDAVCFSTFAYNYKEILNLAKKYEKETVWIFKPHPSLKYKAIKHGIFNNEKEWEQYEDEWKNLNNADVINDGSYYDLFIHSDGMILDSVSFLAEYLYVNKPLLFLRREGQCFNDFGKKLLTVHYSADGNDILAIEKFIENVIIKQNDKNKDIREAFFFNNLDYLSVFGKSAAENIFNQIQSELEK